MRIASRSPFGMGKKSRRRNTKTKVEREKGKRLEISFGEYIHHISRFLKLFGMWKLDRDFSKWKTILITINTTVLLTCNFFLGLSELTKLHSAPDLPSIASGIGAFWLHFIGFFKWLYFVWKVHDVMNLIEQLEECYKLSLEMSESDEGASRIRKDMSTARKRSIQFTYVWGFFVIYGVVHWCMNPVFLVWSLKTVNMSLSVEGRPLPYETWIPWDTIDELGYGYAYFIEFLGSLASCIGAVAYDVFYVTLVMMICAQLRYLNYFLTDQGENHATNKSSTPRQKPTYWSVEKKLRIGKIHHNAILKSLASLEKVTSPVMFVQCIGTVGILCLVSFEATTMNLKGDPKNMIRVWSMLEYIIGCFTQLFAFCYFATEVTTLGLQVADSTYNCGWQLAVSEKPSFPDDGATRTERKSMGFLMCEIIMRAQRPVRLTGGPFYVLSLQTYRAVVSAAFSYSAVLRSFGEE